MTALPLVVIPARFASTRLPGKPTVLIDGVPLLVRTWRRAVEWAGSDGVLVATDSSRVVDLCTEFGMACRLTQGDHATGTDRVAEIVQALGLDQVINVQGDEPLLLASDIEAVHRAASTSGADVVNGMCPAEPAEMTSPTVPKVVTTPAGRLLYASRSPIPGSKSGEPGAGWKQVCIYSFGATALERFAESQRTPLESAEDIEILRFVELGLTVQMAEVSSSSIAVDVPDDVQRVEERLRRDA